MRPNQPVAKQLLLHRLNGRIHEIFSSLIKLEHLRAARPQQVLALQVDDEPGLTEFAEEQLCLRAEAPSAGPSGAI